ncbi:putative cytokinetic ring protein SteA [Brevibacillus choshinensis]|uniref:putative cytokinetic ring protein SteA n=1 Tax=Brevibacillus choshinensis TaxID=54911 RepID=UPI00399CD2E1
MAEVEQVIKRKKPDVFSCTAVIMADRKTKQLCKKLHSDHIALIDHADVDEMAARSLLDAGVQVVINLSAYMTGHYPAEGARRLLMDGISLYEVPTNLYDEQFIDRLNGCLASIEDNQLTVYTRQGDKQLIPLQIVTAEYIQAKWKEANDSLDETLSRFIDNTLQYASREKDLFLKPLYPLSLRTKMDNRHVVVVVRGKHYREDLQTLHAYIREYRPVLIGVDGGADALMHAGYIPDLIVGDMDSVSDKALQCGAEIVVHAFANGHAPGQVRMNHLGVSYHLLPAPGTSEDVAMLLAYEENAQLIVTIGTHTNMIDFLEKGRKGMASTLLVRTKIGTKLIDAKGVNQLYQPRWSWKLWGWCLAAMLTPIGAALVINPVARHAAQMLWTQWRIWAF